LQEDGVYHIDVTKDLIESWVFYRIAFDRDENDIRFIRIQLKKYLPQLEFVVKVNYINYPKDFSRQELLREYKIKPRKRTRKWQHG
jgi:hypothetical protein